MSTGWAPEAGPRVRAEMAALDRCPDVVDAAAARGITSVLHFTQLPGAVGILHDDAVRCRADLPTEKHLEFVYSPNAFDRSRDRAWHGYVNLSISLINRAMFQSSVSWHGDDHWVLFDFDINMLGDPGVVFTTTNNAYADTIRRAEGLAGFEQMFRDRVPYGYYGSVHVRSTGKAAALTTDPQAEVLYPHELNLSDLNAILLQNEDDLESIEGVLAHFPHDVTVDVRPEVF